MGIRPRHQILYRFLASFWLHVGSGLRLIPICLSCLSNAHPSPSWTKREQASDVEPSEGEVNTIKCFYRIYFCGHLLLRASGAGFPLTIDLVDCVIVTVYRSFLLAFPWWLSLQLSSLVGWLPWTNRMWTRLPSRSFESQPMVLPFALFSLLGEWSAPGIGHFFNLNLSVGRTHGPAQPSTRNQHDIGMRNKPLFLTTHWDSGVVCYCCET